MSLIYYTYHHQERPINPLFPNSNLSFHLWVERIAWAIAREEGPKMQTNQHINLDFIVDLTKIIQVMKAFSFLSTVSIARSSTSLTMRPCGTAFAYTSLPNAERSVTYGCVIGVRRKFIPPSIDTFQDMVFVLKGVKQSVEKRSNEPNFMQTLEQIVDSLSPTVMD
eukprot:1047010-Amorphochlora_amoeboformis.AAC.1